MEQEPTIVEEPLYYQKYYLVAVNELLRPQVTSRVGQQSCWTVDDWWFLFVVNLITSPTASCRRRCFPWQFSWFWCLSVLDWLGISALARFAASSDPQSCAFDYCCALKRRWVARKTLGAWRGRRSDLYRFFRQIFSFRVRSCLGCFLSLQGKTLLTVLRFVRVRGDCRWTLFFSWLLLGAFWPRQKVC